MAFRRKITSPGAKLAVVLAYIAVITLSDVYFYGIVYQQEIKNGSCTNPVYLWVFEESGKEQVYDSTESKTRGGNEHITVPRYRVIQKVIEIGGLLIVLYFCGLFPAIGLLISHYLLTYDMLFYLILDPGFVNEIERSVFPYWLVNWYQIGYFILKPFNSLFFYLSGMIGLLIAVSSCYFPRKSRNHL